MDRGSSSPTFGIEEEFLLLDPDTGHPAPRAEDVLGDITAADSAATGPCTAAFTAEFTRFQLEANTPVCRTAAEARGQLGAARRSLAAAVDRRNLRLVSTGYSPLGIPDPVPITAKPRYQNIGDRFGLLLNSHATTGCHIHVGMPDLATSLAVSNHLRPHLPVLLALTANSPFCGGRDSGHASWRTVVWSRLPSAGPPPLHRNPASYQRAVDLLLSSGAALDRAMVYWFARPAPHLSTLEVRVADAAATADESLLLALLVRALAMTALQDIAEGRPAPEFPDERLRLAMWRAAHDGLEGQGLDSTGELVPARFLLDELVKTALPALDTSGDTTAATDVLDRLLRHGSGAHRQRLAHARRDDITDVIALLSEQTRSSLPD
ncbi:carboxylate-amine ligase [Saccharopolyspora phatthalungensis]|uniref:Putative glutamate--cysteine ligase 2 n=1 Tax=Saccharopolyspora phatthalungensis TaxID=664693 RepID=A0A840QDM8_9PSEU|nr:glutamate--cysteine ligase [Saccharopolyspora phatthalungensis]MBB5158031.1 carboxylate-amine ligase [Saccharopolyspora phatthalungensis]